MNKTVQKGFCAERGCDHPRAENSPYCQAHFEIRHNRNVVLEMMQTPPGFTLPNTCIPDELMRVWDTAFELGVECGHGLCMRGFTLELALIEAKKQIALAMLKTERKINR